MGGKESKIKRIKARKDEICIQGEDGEDENHSNKRNKKIEIYK